MTTYANTPAPGPETLLQHAGFVRGVARALVRGDADVDDVVQATWLSVLEGGPKRPLPVRGWLATVTRRRAADLHRREARLTRRERAAARPEATASTVELAEKAELGRRMVGAVLALDEPYRSAILLRYYEDLPPRDVATRLEVPVETARTRVKRGLGKLRDEFDREEGGDRRAWVTGLLPLLNGHAAVPVAAAAGGAGTLLKLLLAALVLVGGGLLVRSALDDQGDDVAVDEIVRDVEDAVLRGSTDAVAPPEARRAKMRGAIEGLVVRAGHPTAARVELRRLENRSEGAPLLAAKPDWLYGGVVGGGAPLAATTSAADGRFVFADVVAGDYEVRAVDGARTASLQVSLLGAKPGTRLRLDLPDGDPVLVGQALHADGRPFRGWIRAHLHEHASVTIAPFGVDLAYGEGLFPVDDEGIFEVYGLSPGTIRLAAFRPGALRYLSRPLAVPYEGTFAFVVDEGMTGVRGFVVAHDGGHPIADAVVTASAVAGMGERAWTRVRTDADGRFLLTLPASELAMEVSAASYVTARVGATLPEPATYTAYGRFTHTGAPGHGPLERPDDGSVIVRLLRAPGLSGRVVERGTDRPVGDVAVYAVAADFSSTNAWARATSLADGTFHFADAPAGWTTVFAAGDGWISAEVAGATEARVHGLQHPLEPGSSTELALEVVRSVRATGRVVDARGAPVAGAAVRPEPSTALPPITMGSPMWLGSAVTDSDGRFVLDPLVAGHAYRIYAQPPEGVLTMTDSIPVGPEGVEDVVIEVPDSVWISVRVLDAVTDAPIANARVWAHGYTYDHYILPHTFHTGPDGTVLAGPVPAVEAVRIIAEAAGYLKGDPVGEPIDAREAAGRETTLRLQPGEVVTGRVTAPKGIDPGGLWVHVNPSSRGQRRSNHPYRVRTDASGAFRVHGLIPEEEYGFSTALHRDLLSYRAEATAKGSATAVDLHLALDETQTAWRVRVLDPEGRPVPSAVANVHVKVAGEDHHVDEGGMVEGGEVVLRTHAPVGEAWVEIHHAKDEGGVPLDAGAVYRHDLPTGGGEVEFRLAAAQRIAGAVVGPDRVGIAGVKVYAHPAYDPPARWRRDKGSRALAETDADGAFTLDRLGLGDYLLVFVCPPTHLAPDLISVPAGSEDVNVVLAAAVTPRIDVRDGDGAPVVGAEVVASPAKPRPGAQPSAPRARTGADGAALLPALAPDGQYRLVVSPPAERRDDLAPFDLTPWTPEDRTVVLSFAGNIGGRVVDQAGEPYPKAEIRFRTAGEEWKTLRAQDDGSFRILRLPREQAYELFACGGFAGGGEPPAGEVLLVRPGDEHLELEALRPIEVVVRIEEWPPKWTGVMGYMQPQGGHPMVTVIQTDGTATYPNMAANLPFSFYAGPLPDGRYARADRIAPGASSAVATLRKGLEIRGRLETPPGAERASVWLYRDGMSLGANGTLTEDGTFRFHALYEGTWTIRASATVDGTWKQAETQAEAGATDVVLTFD